MANEYLNRTPTSTGNRSVYTWSGWVKINEINLDKYLFSSGDDSSNIFYIQFRRDANNNNLTILFRDGDTTSHSLVFDDNSYRDPSSWIHLVVAVDTTITTPTQDRVKVYINGKRLINPTTDQLGNLSANSQTSTNALELHTIGDYSVTSGSYAKTQIFDYYLVDGQALTPDVFGFYKEGKGYQSSGTTQATDFRPGQWVPKAPRTIKSEINRKGEFGVNGFYLPMNDSSNFGADFHCDPNTIIKLKGEDLPQPRNGAPTTTDSYVSQLRTDAYASNLVLAVPGITDGQGSGYGDYSADIKGSGSNKTITANGNAGVAVTASYYGSAMQFDGTGDYFSVPNSSDLRFTTEDFTIETWFNTNSLTDDQFIFSQWNVTDDRRSYVLWLDAGVLKFNGSTDGSNSTNGNVTNTISVGANQWNHAAFSREGTTTRLFLNGVCIGISTATDTFYNNTDDTPRIGGESGSGTREFDGYIQDLRVYKGVAKYTGGFDVSKPYTPVGIGTWRQVPDTCKNNFATLNPLNCYGGTSSSATLTNGNLTVTTTDANRGHRSSTIGITTGKWYAEVQVQNSQTLRIGVIADKSTMQETDNVGFSRSEFSYVTTGAYGFNDALPAYGDTYTNNDVIGIALNRTDGTITFFKNGVSQGIATDILNNGDYDDQYFHFISADSSLTESGVFSWNFGQNPTFSGNVSAALTQRNADANGIGEFKYAPPAGHLALCEDNLPTPAIADPGEHFKCVLYTGDGNGGRSITGVGFKPDLVWIKERSSTSGNALFDSVRGPGFRLVTDTNAAEDHVNKNVHNPSFNNDGFTVGSDGAVNQSGQTYVAWCWKAGGPAVENAEGSITSQVSVNQDAGFSIVSYTGTGANATVGHGLDKTPNIVLCKTRPDVTNWSFNGNVAGLIYGSNKLRLQHTDGITGDTNEVMSANATTFSKGNSTATNGTADAMIAYCWYEVKNFSKFGSYIGNGDADGAFVYCGFKPAWIMIKQTNDANNWHIADSSRKSVNPVNMVLRANLSNAESANNTSFDIDFLSNGFKLRSTNDELNENNSSYFFMAFAESPFQTANAK